MNVPLLSLLILSQIEGPISGQMAMDRVKSALKAFGVHGSLRLQELSSVTVSDKPVLLHVVFSNPPGGNYEAYVHTEGRSFQLWHGSERASLNGLKSSPLPNQKYEQLTRKWLASVAANETTQLKSMTVDENGNGRAYFAILRNGYPFVSHPRYGYEFVFKVSSGEFVAFRGDQKPPETDPTPPKLDEAGALAALKRIWDTEITPEAINVHHFKRVWYTNLAVPELGYYLPEGKRKAILVWRLSYTSSRDVGYAIQGGSDAMLIDAVTGQRIRTTVVP